MALVVLGVCLVAAALFLAVRERGWPTISISDDATGEGDDGPVELTPAIGQAFSFQVPSLEDDEDDDE